MTRAPTVRASELEVNERKWPLLVAINYGAVCHISTHNGILRAGHERHKNPHDQVFNMTRCGRALRYTVTERAVPADEFLCARCGARADFQAAMDKHDRAWAEYNREERVKDAARTAARQLERDRQTAVLKALYEAFAWDDVSWSPKTGETDRGQQVIYLSLEAQLPGVITVGERAHAYPHHYRAVVTLELIPKNEEEEQPGLIAKYQGHTVPGT